MIFHRVLVLGAGVVAAALFATPAGAQTASEFCFGIHHDGGVPVMDLGVRTDVVLSQAVVVGADGSGLILDFADQGDGVQAASSQFGSDGNSDGHYDVTQVVAADGLSLDVMTFFGGVQPGIDYAGDNIECSLVATGATLTETPAEGAEPEVVVETQDAMPPAVAATESEVDDAGGDSDEGGLPVVPIVIGVGLVAAGGVAVAMRKGAHHGEISDEEAAELKRKYTTLDPTTGQPFQAPPPLTGVDHENLTGKSTINTYLDALTDTPGMPGEVKPPTPTMTIESVKDFETFPEVPETDIDLAPPPDEVM